jgi:hypothetical protein
MKFSPLIVELLEFILISSCNFFELLFTSIYDLNTNVNSWRHNFIWLYIVLVPILMRTRNDAPRCIRVLFMNRKTYDLRGLRFLHVDDSVRCCSPQHVEITHKQGKKSSSFVIHIKPPFFLTSKRSFTEIDPRLAKNPSKCCQKLPSADRLVGHIRSLDCHVVSIPY